MKAWLVTGAGIPSDVLRLVDIEVPTPGPGEIRLRVEAAAIGLPDVFMCQGVYPLTPAGVFVPGQEVCGIVDAVGDEVDVPLGARLMAVTNFFDGRGGFAEFTIAQAESAYPAPPAMTAADAASFRIGFSTAWIGLVRRGLIQRGETLLVLGAAGGSGITAVQLGQALGARVLAVTSGEERGAFCRAHGADAVIDRTAGDVTAAVDAATDGRGVDVVYDPVGGEVASAIVRNLARDGRLLAVGFASGSWVQPDTHTLVRRNASLVGVYAGGLSRADNEADHRSLMSLVEAGYLRGTATTMPFDSLPEGVEAVRASAVLGKVVITPGG